jgi:hypothetical protein
LILLISSFLLFQNCPKDKEFFDSIGDLNLSGHSEELVWDGTWELAHISTSLQECDLNIK